MSLGVPAVAGTRIRTSRRAGWPASAGNGPLAVLMPNTGKASPVGRAFSAYRIAPTGPVRRSPEGMSPVTGGDRSWGRSGSQPSLGQTTPPSTLPSTAHRMRPSAWHHCPSISEARTGARALPAPLATGRQTVDACMSLASWRSPTPCASSGSGRSEPPSMRLDAGPTSRRSCRALLLPPGLDTRRVRGIAQALRGE